MSIPVEEDLKYDLIAERNGICKRVQVRYTTPRNNILRVKLRSCWANSKGVHTINRKQGDFDILAVYCPTNNIVYFIDDKEFDNSTGINFKLLESEKKNQYKSRMENEYIDATKLFKEGCLSG